LYRGLVFSLARRSTCSRAKVGAVVTVNNRLVGAGYNGSPKGTPHCIDEDEDEETIGCLLGEGGHCIRCIHAEVNALIHSEITIDSPGTKIVWTSLYPCVNCVKLCIAFGVSSIYYCLYRDDSDSKKFLSSIGSEVIRVEQLSF
jgi:dCMP deaminase